MALLEVKKREWVLGGNKGIHSSKVSTNQYGTDDGVGILVDCGNIQKH